MHVFMARSVTFSLWLLSTLLLEKIQQQSVFGATDWAQFGALGVLAGVMLYLYNQQNKQHREELKEIYERHSAENKEKSAAFDKAREEHRREFRDLSERLLVAVQSGSEATQSLVVAMSDIHKQLDQQSEIKDTKKEIAQMREEMMREIRNR